MISRTVLTPDSIKQAPSPQQKTLNQLPTESVQPNFLSTQEFAENYMALPYNLAEYADKQYYDFAYTGLFNGISTFSEDYCNHAFERHGIFFYNSVYKFIELLDREQGKKYNNQIKTNLKPRTLHVSDLEIDNNTLELRTIIQSEEIFVPASYYYYCLFANKQMNMRGGYKNFSSHINGNNKASLLLSTMWGGEEMFKKLGFDPNEIIVKTRWGQNTLLSFFNEVSNTSNAYVSRLKPFSPAEYIRALKLLNMSDIMDVNEGEDLVLLQSDTVHHAYFRGFNDVYLNYLSQIPAINNNPTFLYRIKPTFDQYSKTLIPELITCLPEFHKVDTTVPKDVYKGFNVSDLEAYYFPNVHVL